MKLNEIYADKIGQTSYANGVIRLNFESIQADETGAFSLSDVSAELVIPLQKFLDSYSVMKQAMDQFFESGVFSADSKKKTTASRAAKKPSAAGKNKKTGKASEKTA